MVAALTMMGAAPVVMVVSRDYDGGGCDDQGDD